MLTLRNGKVFVQKFWYRCPKCAKRVGQISDKYNPWCQHGNTDKAAFKMAMMELEKTDDIQIQGQ
jgi:hypothetical protein